MLPLLEGLDGRLVAEETLRNVAVIEAGRARKGRGQVGLGVEAMGLQLLGAMVPQAAVETRARHGRIQKLPGDGEQVIQRRRGLTEIDRAMASWARCRRRVQGGPMRAVFRRKTAGAPCALC